MTHTSYRERAQHPVRWVAGNLGLLVLLILAVFAVVALIERGSSGPRFGDAAYASYLMFGAMLVPTLLYLLLLWLLPGVWSRPQRRIAAVALSPISMMAWYLSVGLSTSPDLYREILEGVVVPLTYGVIVRLPRKAPV